MAFSFTTDSDPYEQVGRLKVIMGTYNAASVTTGEIDTGLTRVLFAVAQPTGATVSTNSNVFNETFPFDGSTLTLICDSGETGVWMAWGY